MVFVVPDLWGRGVGGRLLDGLHEQMAVRGWSRSSLWTGSTNARAQRLYESRDYWRAGDTKRLEDGESILRYARAAR